MTHSTHMHVHACMHTHTHTHIHNSISRKQSPTPLPVTTPQAVLTQALTSVKVKDLQGTGKNQSVKWREDPDGQAGSVHDSELLHSWEGAMDEKGKRVHGELSCGSEKAVPIPRVEGVYLSCILKTREH